MNIKHLSVIKEPNNKCISVMGDTTVREYLDYIREIYNDKGGIEHQRAPLHSSSAVKIRKRMIADIEKGTILPAVVIGLILDDDRFNTLCQEDFEHIDINKYLSEADKDNISLIDGMQRTTALIEAIEHNKEVETHTIRVEIWAVRNISNLIYRMLVLNTGQVPWTTRRQLEVVFSSVLKRIKESAPELTIYDVDDVQKRKGPKEYQANDILEMCLAFGARKEKVDLKERIAEEFSRLDFTETSESDEFIERFVSFLNLMGDLDACFSKYIDESPLKPQFKNGEDLFNSQPARIGFITAISIFVFGRPGNLKTEQEQQDNTERIFNSVGKLIDRLNGMDNKQIGDFLSFATLNERFNGVNVSKVGDFQRALFKDAFGLLIKEDFNVESLESCWREY